MGIIRIIVISFVVSGLVIIWSCITISGKASKIEDEEWRRESETIQEKEKGAL